MADAEDDEADEAIEGVGVVAEVVVVLKRPVALAASGIMGVVASGVALGGVTEGEGPVEWLDVGCSQ